MQDPQILTSVGSKILELSAGGIFAVILIDKVLGWTIKLKGNGKNNRNGRIRCVQTPELVLMADKIKGICNDNEAAAKARQDEIMILTELSGSAGRQEKLLEEISKKLD